MTEREKERAAIVAWLRAKRADDMTWADRAVIKVLGIVADAIERGHHMKGTGDE